MFFFLFAVGCSQGGKIEELLGGSIGGSTGSNSAIKVNSSNASAIVLTGTCDTEGAAVQISGSGTGSTICQNGQWTATVDASHAPDGPVEFTATITLSDGTTASTILNGTKRTTPPTVTITTNPTTAIHSGNVTSYAYTGTCSETGKTVTISSGSFSDTTTCAGGTWTKSLDVSSLAEGTVSFNAKQTDDVGNTTTAYQNQFKDTLAPANGSTSFTGAPSGVNGTTTLNVTVNGAGDADRYMYKVGLAASTDCSVITGYGNETLIATPITANISALADGSVKLCAITRDTYGNYQAPIQAAVATWTKDANAPSISGIAGPSPALGNSSTSFVFTVTYSENVTVNTSAANVTLGGTATAGCTKAIAQGAANTAVITVTNCSGNGTLNIASLAANTATDVGSNQASAYSTASSNATVDNTAPTISGITGPTPASGTSATSFVYTVTFSESVTVSTTAANATLSGATAGCSKVIAQGAANTATVTVSGCTGNGTFLIDAMAAGSGVDAAGNNSVVYNTDSSSATVDNTAPTVTGISAPSPTVGKSSTSFVFTITFSENVTVSTTASNITLGGTDTAGCTKTVAQGAANTATVTVANCSGNGTVFIDAVAAGTGVDVTSANSVAYSTDSSAATVDNTAPTISSVTGPSPAAGKSSTSLVWTVNFSENVTINTATTSNVTIGGTATAGCAVTIATASATSGTVSITGCTGNGTLNISNLAAGLAADAAGNALVPWVVGSSDGTIDNTAPTISSISAPSPSVGKSSSSFVYTVTFSENVTVSTTSTNATLGGTATTGCSVAIAQGAANTATVTVTSCSGNGTVLIDAMASASGVDAAGNNSTAYTTDSSAATVDNTAPTISSISAPSPAAGKSDTNIVFTVTFSENVTVSTTSTNATLGGTATTGCAITIAQGAANTATVTVTSCSGNGTVLIDAMASASGVDAAGNNSTAYTTDSSSATVDNTAPTVSSISAPSPSSGGSSTSFVFTVTYSENVTVVNNTANVTLGGTTTGCSKAMAQGAANTITITVSACSGTGTMNVASLSAGTATDAAGNNAASYSTASGNATLTQGAASDPYFHATTLLMHFDSSNNDTGFVDVSSSPKTTTVGGSAVISSAETLFGKSTGSFPGGSSRVYFNDVAALEPGSNSFTMEFWFKPTSPSGLQTLFCKGLSSDYGAPSLFLNGNTIYFYSTSTNSGYDLFSGQALTSVTTGTWNHVVIVRNGNTWSGYVNGTRYFNATVAGTLYDQSSGWSFGATSDGGYSFNGYLADIRYSQGTARYSGASITVPTAHVGSDASTSFYLPLIGFQDSSGWQNNATVSGNVKISTAQSKFGGSSLYSDGASSSTLSVPMQALGSTFTVELWFRAAASVIGGNLRLFSQTNSSTALDAYFNSGTGYLYMNGGTVTSTWAPTVNTWYHIAIVMTNGNVAVYVDGSPITLGGTTTGFNYTSTANLLLFNFSGGGYGLNAYMDELRITKGVARYPSTNVPSSAFSSDANTVALLHAENLVDSSGTHTITANGNATVSSAQSKFGTSSFYLDGSSWLTAPASTTWDISSGDFTIEAWIYSTNGAGYIFKQNPGSFNGYELWLTGSKLRFNADSTTAIMTSINNVPQNQWAHIAVSKQGSIVRMFINGVLEGAAAGSPVFTSGQGIAIGTYNGSSSMFTGYIDELRFTKGVARYTDGFSVATSAFGEGTFWNSGDKSNTTLSNGNTRYFNSSGSYGHVRATGSYRTGGKYYMEVKVESGSGLNMGALGIATSGFDITYSQYLGYATGSVAMGMDFWGRLYMNQSSIHDAADFANGDIMMMAVDLDNGKIWYGKNGTWFNSGNPAAGTNALQTFTGSTGWKPANDSRDSSDATARFSSGSWGYPAPSGFSSW